MTESSTDEPEQEQEMSTPGISSPGSDIDKPVEYHVQEMFYRISTVVIFIVIGTLFALPWSSDLIQFMWQDTFSFIDADVEGHIYNPLELWITRIQVAGLFGILLGIPMFVYQTYGFMRPALFDRERKYYLAAVPTSVVFAITGMVVGYFILLPIIFFYFTGYAEGTAQLAYGVGDTFNLIIAVIGMMAIIFQIPLFIILAVLMGIKSRAWFASKRIYFWGLFTGIGFIFTLDPTLMVPILMVVIMILLFELTLLILKWLSVD